MSRRKRYDSRFKAQVAIEAIKNQQTVAQIASEYGVHPNQVSQWKKQVLEQLPQLFTTGTSKATSDTDQLVDELYRQIGQLKVELDWLEKKRNGSIEQKRQLIEQGCGSPSVVRQCELLGLSRASYYNGPQYSGQELSKKFGLTHPYKWRIENVNQTDSSYCEIQVYYCR